VIGKIVVLLSLLLTMPGCSQHSEPAAAKSLAPAQSTQHARNEAGLPQEALETLRLIETGGPFPYRKDGSIFQNRENQLPRMPRGYYREYTVRTPGSGDRGARRIVAGGNPPEVFYYTADHYRSFRRIRP